MKSDTEQLVVIAFAANALLAGGNSVAVRFLNRELDPIWGAALRFVIPAVILAVLMAALKQHLPRGRALAGAILYGVFQFGGAFGLVHHALVGMQAGQAQTLLALVPLFTLLLAVAVRQERITVRTGLGTLLGFAGVLLVLRNPTREVVSLVSVLEVLGSVLCFAIAAVLVRRFPPIHPIVMNGVGMAAGAVVLVALSGLLGQTFELPQLPHTWIALGYVTVFGSVVVFLLYVYVLHNWTASRAAYVMVVIPFITISLSAWLDREAVGVELILGGLLVLTGVYIGALRRAQTSPTPPAAALCGLGATGMEQPPSSRI